MIKQLISTSIVITIFIATLALNLFLYTNPEILSFNNITREYYYFSNKTELELEIEKLEKVEKSPSNKIFTTGWIPDWDLADGLSTLKKQSSAFDSISPFWLIPNDDGSVREVLNNANPEILSFSKSNNIKLIPTVPLFDFEQLSKILNNPENFERHVQAILFRVDQYDYDGIDLDYEATQIIDKKLFFEFLERMSSEMKARNKTFVFTVLPKWGDEILYPSLPQTRIVQDYKKVGDLVDEFRIMTYDFFGRTTTEAGPIGPLPWIERVIQYTIKSGVPRDKIVLGVHTYSYDWSERPIVKEIDLVNWYGNLANIPNLEPGSAYYASDLVKVIQNYNLEYTFNAEWGEAIGTYNFQGAPRIVIFPNQESIDLRKKLAQEYGIKGIAIWRVGDEASLKY